MYSNIKKKDIVIAILLGVLTIILQLYSKDYFDDKPNNVAKVTSDFGSIWIFDEDDSRCMSFLEPPTPIVQSCMNKSNHKIILYNYAKLFTSTLFFVDNPRKILVIGLGGASIQRALNTLLPNTQIDSVEINDKIPSLVEKYFDYKENYLNKIYIADGAEFAKNVSQETYDIILIDAFSADYIPPQMLTDEFMQNVKKMLTKNGVVAINTFANTKFSNIETDLFKNNFDNHYNLIVDSSKVMIAGKNPLPTFDQIKDSANLWRFRFVEIGVNQYVLLNLFKNLAH